MKRVACIALGTCLLGSAADGRDLIKQGFEGAFPPKGWYVVTTGGGWGKSQWPEPTGYHAAGYAGDINREGFWDSTLWTHSFDVERGRKIYYRFGYMTGWNGDCWGHVTFYLAYHDYPEDTIARHRLKTKFNDWHALVETVIPPRAGKLCARWHILCSSSWHGGWITAAVDNVYISEDGFPAVVPMSLGRVKALFR